MDLLHRKYFSYYLDSLIIIFLYMTFTYLSIRNYKKKKHSDVLLRRISIILIWYYWIGINPYIESLFAVTRCKSSSEYIDVDHDITCRGLIHICLIILSSLMAIFTIFLLLMTSVFFQKTCYPSFDALSLYYIF